MNAMMRRGQAWGVMEILIAVIILGMSMALVFYALKSISDTQCVAQLKANTVSLQNAMLDVALGSPPTQRTVTYSMPTCGDRSVEAIHFVRYSKPEYCRICPGQFGSCWVIEPMVYDASSQKYFTLTDASVCVNMPAAIHLNPVTSDTAPDTCPKDPADTLSSKPHFSIDCPCPPVPGTNTCPTDCSTKFSSAGVWSRGNPSEVGLFSTFGRSPGDPRTFVFELSKRSSVGVASTIDICARTTVK